MPKLEVKHVSSKSLDSSSSSSSHSFNSTSALKTVSIKSFIFIIILIGILIYISWCFFSNIFLIKNLQDENSLFEEEIIRIKKERKELNEQNDKLETEVKILEQQKKQAVNYEESLKNDILYQEKLQKNLQNKANIKLDEEKEFVDTIQKLEEKKRFYIYTITNLERRIKNIMNDN